MPPPSYPTSSLHSGFLTKADPFYLNLTRAHRYIYEGTNGNFGVLQLEILSATIQNVLSH